MDAATLKQLKIGNQKTFEKLVAWGWISPTGRELTWRDWCNTSSLENVGRESQSFVPRPYAKTAEERNRPRVLRHDRPAPSNF